jgi:spermidine/putrescine transport system permease protein
MTAPIADDRRRPGFAAWAVMTPLLVWLLLLVAVPTAALFAYSFCHWETDDDTNVTTFTWTLDNYREIFTPAAGTTLLHAALAGTVGAIVGVLVAGPTRRGRGVRLGFVAAASVYLSWAIRHLPKSSATNLLVFWRSVEVAAGTTALCLLIGYPVAFFIGRSGPVWRNRLLLAVTVPFWTSFLLRTYAWITILKQEGMLNAVLNAARLGVLIPASGAFLYTPTAVVIGLVYAYLPFMILPIFSTVEKIDPSLIEASLDLGVGPIGTLRKVILPLTAPGIAAGVLLVFVPAIGMFAVSSLLGGDRHPLIGDVINAQFTELENGPFGAALGVVLMAAFGLVFLVTGFHRPREA